MQSNSTESSQDPQTPTPVTAVVAGAVAGVLAFLCILNLTGCSNLKPKKENPAIDQMLDREVGDVSQGLASRIMSGPASRSSKTRGALEREMQKKIWWWLRYYTVRDRERFERILKRGEDYRPLVQQVLTKHHLPPELYYLAMIESGYVTNARSTASAAGIWQFMRPTALNYGLGVDHHRDERNHPIAATHAAARYLIFLHKKFNSWYLAIAAYNACQGRIMDAVRKGKTRDFWKLADRGHLPQETMDYIPKFLAAATIGEHLEEFGFEPQESNQEWPEIASIELKLHKLKPKKAAGKISLIASQAKLSEEELLRFNPQLKQALSHPTLKRIRIWVPRKSVEDFLVSNTRTSKNG